MLDFIPISMPWITSKEKENVLEAVNSTWVSSKGKFINELENKKLLTKTNKNLCVSNGTIALCLAFESLLGRKQKKILVPNLTFGATANAIVQSNNIPVFYEQIDSGSSLEPDYKSIEDSGIINEISALVIVHLFGEACNLLKAKEFCQKHNLLLIEDCAEAPLAKDINGIQTGTIGDSSTFSFFANKVISTGEGGLTSFIKEEFYEKAKVIRDHGMDPEKKYMHNISGSNYRMTNVQAAMGIAQISRVDEIIELRNKILEIYKENLDHDFFNFMPRKFLSSEPSPWFFILKLNKFDNEKHKLIEENLKENNIEFRNLFYPLKEQKAFKNFQLITSKKIFSSASLSKNGLMLPLHHELTNSKIKRICEVLSKVIND